MIPPTGIRKQEICKTAKVRKQNRGSEGQGRRKGEITVGLEQYWFGRSKNSRALLFKVHMGNPAALHTETVL